MLALLSHSQPPAAFPPEPFHGPIWHTGAHSEPPIARPSSGEDHTQGLVTLGSNESHAQGVVILAQSADLIYQISRGTTASMPRGLFAFGYERMDTRASMWVMWALACCSD